MAEFLISLPALERNARILAQTAEASGAHMLLALKAFSSTSCFSTIRPYTAGCCASGLYEARLAARKAEYVEPEDETPAAPKTAEGAFGDGVTLKDDDRPARKSKKNKDSNDSADSDESAE